MAEEVKCLPTNYEALSSNHSTTKKKIKSRNLRKFFKTLFELNKNERF
jgi:hypothetical protein